MAETLGKAMRFASMLLADGKGSFGRLNWDRDQNQLNLMLPEASRALFGEVAEARFRSLASALNAAPNVAFDL